MQYPGSHVTLYTVFLRGYWRLDTLVIDYTGIILLLCANAMKFDRLIFWEKFYKTACVRKPLLTILSMSSCNGEQWLLVMAKVPEPDGSIITAGSNQMGLVRMMGHTVAY